MKKKSWHLDRKTYLRGSGVSLALPFLNGMLAGTGLNKEKKPKRVAFIYFPNGVSLPPKDDAQYEDWTWFPKGEGRNFEFRMSQKYLNPFREDLSVISGLSNPANRSYPSHMGSTGYLTTKAMYKKSTTNSISIDQEISRHFAGQTQLNSLVLSSVGGVGSLYRTYTLSFDQNGKAIPSISKLKYVYERMYMASSPVAIARLKRKQHLLNEVYQDAKILHAKLGQEDQFTLDEYLSSLTDLEKKLKNDQHWVKRGAEKVMPKFDVSIHFEDVEAYIQAMYELIYLSFKADITRVATFQIGSEGGDSPVGQMSKLIGLSKDLHSLSHGAGKGPTGYRDWGMWDQFIAKQFAYFLQRLKETKEGESNLLDHSLILQGSATGRSHDPHNYPLILAGGKDLGHRTGQYIRYKEQDHALSNLFVKMAHAVDVPIKNFGDSTGNAMSELFV